MNGFGLQGGYISEHEGKSEVFRTDSHFLFSSICGDCIFINIDRCLKMFHLFFFNPKNDSFSFLKTRLNRSQCLLTVVSS